MYPSFHTCAFAARRAHSAASHPVSSPGLCPLDSPLTSPSWEQALCGPPSVSALTQLPPLEVTFSIRVNPSSISLPLGVRPSAALKSPASCSYIQALPRSGLFVNVSGFLYLETASESRTLSGIRISSLCVARCWGDSEQSVYACEQTGVSAFQQGVETAGEPRCRQRGCPRLGSRLPAATWLPTKCGTCLQVLAARRARRQTGIRAAPLQPASRKSDPVR